MMDEETRYQFLNGFDEESYLVAAIRKYLLTPEQKQEMFNRDVDIADVLNGRVPYADDGWLGPMFEDWNKKVGGKAFGF